MPRGKWERTTFKPIADRLWRRTLKTETCWLWRGATGHFGHGQIMADRNVEPTRRILTAHRVSWELANGPIPDGLCVLHKCDVPRCVRPDHLFLGTKRDNMADAAAKGRSARGSRLPQTKLTEDAVREIRASNETQTALAKRYGVSQAAISMARTGAHWSHVK